MARTAISIDLRSEAIVNSLIGFAEGASFDHPPARADRELAGDGIDAGVQAGDVGDVDAFAGLGEQALEVQLACLHDEVRGRDRGRRRGSRRATRCRSSGVAALAARGVGVVEVGLETSRLDQRRAPRGMPSPSTGAEPKPSGSRPSSVSVSARLRDSLSQHAGEGRATALDRVGAQHAPMKPKKLAATIGSRTTGSARVGLDRAEQRAARSAASVPIASASSAAGARPRPTPRPVSRSSPSPRDRLQVRVTGGRLEAGGDADRADDRCTALPVGVNRLLDLRDTAVGGAAGRSICFASATLSAVEVAGSSGS